MSRTVRLEDVGITYTEEKDMRLYIHLVVEEGGKIAFYATVAQNLFEAVLSVGTMGKVVHTQPMIKTLGVLSVDAIIDDDDEKG